MRVMNPVFGNKKLQGNISQSRASKLASLIGKDTNGEELTKVTVGRKSQSFSKIPGQLKTSWRKSIFVHE